MENLGFQTSELIFPVRRRPLNRFQRSVRDPAPLFYIASQLNKVAEFQMSIIIHLRFLSFYWKPFSGVSPVWDKKSIDCCRRSAWTGRHASCVTASSLAKYIYISKCARGLLPHCLLRQVLKPPTKAQNIMAFLAYASQ